MLLFLVSVSSQAYWRTASAVPWNHSLSVGVCNHKTRAVSLSCYVFLPSFTSTTSPHQFCITSKAVHPVHSCASSWHKLYYLWCMVTLMWACDSVQRVVFACQDLKKQCTPDWQGIWATAQDGNPRPSPVWPLTPPQNPHHQTAHHCPCYMCGQDAGLMKWS